MSIRKRDERDEESEAAQGKKRGKRSKEKQTSADGNDLEEDLIFPMLQDTT